MGYLYIVGVLAVLVLIIYIYKKLIPGKSQKLDIPDIKKLNINKPLVKTDLPFNPRNIRKPNVP